jgi:predicted RNA methylase
MRVEDAVLNVLANAQTTGNRLVLVGQLERNLYVRANKVLEAAGGKWNTKAKAHLFPGDAAEAMEQIIQTGQVTVAKDEFGFFPTPPAVVRRLLLAAGIRRDHWVLEPSAGAGAIARALVDAAQDVDCVELLPANVAALRKVLPPNTIVREADFLAIEPEPKYDRIVMNPPFAKQADIRHVLHALKFLKPAGLLVSVMSAGVTFRDDKLTQSFRDLVLERGGDIEALPEGAFKESGTMVRTVIVTIPGDGQEPEPEILHRYTRDEVVHAAIEAEPTSSPEPQRRVLTKADQADLFANQPALFGHVRQPWEITA